MKTPTLIQELQNIETLRKAWKNLNKSNKFSFGASGETIKSFSDNIETNLEEISKKIAKGKYTFSPLRAVAIEKKSQNSEAEKSYRPIKVNEIRDRVVTKAITNLISKDLYTLYHLNNEASYAYQKGIGVEAAIQRMVLLYQAGYKVILEADIEKFFDSVNLTKLLDEKVFPVLKDNTINNLISKALTQEIANRDKLTELELLAFDRTEGGIPQGSALSPLLSNICLSDFDNRMLKNQFGLVRYADDFIVLCKTEEEAHSAFNIATEEIEEKLGLKIYPFDAPKKAARIIRPDRENFEFLSIKFNGRELYPKKEKVIELKEKIRNICSLHRWDTEKNKRIDNNVLTILKRTDNLICGWLSAFSFSDVDRYFEEIDSYSNIQLAHILRQMDWGFKSSKLKKVKYKSQQVDSLSDTQRRYSGVHTCKSFFSEVLIRRLKIPL